METLKNFILAGAGTLGFLQLTDPFKPVNESGDPQELLIKSLLSILAGLLTALLSRAFKRFTDIQRSHRKEKNKQKQSKKQNHGNL
ncbi:MAG: hypothetical protein JEZ14_04730 [Marinilabiliaceae bacterium]|nr:hypothetical protein [Marinilabiliaceae bacterium]